MVNLIQLATRLSCDLLDASSIEVFADDGAVMTELFFPSEPFNKMQIKASKGISIPELKFYTLNPIWMKEDNWRTTLSPTILE